MTRYYFHARLGRHLIPDDVGVELPNLLNIERAVREAILQSRLDLSQDWTFEIVDESGEIVMRVPIAELPRTQ